MNRVGLADVWPDLLRAFEEEGLVLSEWGDRRSAGQQILEVNTRPLKTLLYTRVRRDDGLWGFMDNITHVLEESGWPWFLLKLHACDVTGCLVPSSVVWERTRGGAWTLSRPKGEYKFTS